MTGPGIDPDDAQASRTEALADCERAIALSETEDLEHYRLRAELREELGDLEGAIADQTRMIEMEPWFVDAHMDRARLRKRTGDMAGALSDAARVAELEAETIAELGASFPEATRFAAFNLDAV